jgi:hypothetical protein
VGTVPDSEKSMGTRTRIDMKIWNFLNMFFLLENTFRKLKTNIWVKSIFEHVPLPLSDSPKTQLG